MTRRDDDGISYEDYWGTWAQPVQPRLDAWASISVPVRFVRGPLLRVVEQVQGGTANGDVKAFLEAALKAWYDRYKDRRSRADPGRIQQLLALVPTPREGEAATRLDVHIEDQVKAEAFARVLEARFAATRRGASLALREAVLEALASARPVEDDDARG